MYKENLFELIREEKVVLWAGSGFSLYAGFPSGKELGKIFYDKLTTIEKSSIDENMALPELTEEILRLRGSRNSLIQLLIDVFKNKMPVSREYHDLLARIPHIKTFITTNYDSLIEDALKQNGQVLISAKHIPYIDKNKIQVFKIHGDLSEPDSILLTKSDFNNFFKLNAESDTFWTVIKERIATNNVLFVGYNLEDPNIAVIFEKITDALGSNRKECFLVAPDLPQSKINFLFKQNIHYINSTGENLISELLQNINDNLISDFEKGRTSVETFRRYLANRKLESELISGEEGYKIKAFRSNTGKGKGKFELTLRNDPTFIKKFKEHFSEGRIEEFKIPSEQLLDTDFRIEGLKLPLPDKQTTIRFEPKPIKITTIDIRFEDGFELNDIPIKVFSSQTHVEIHIKIKSALMHLKLFPGNYPEFQFNFKYIHNELCATTIEEIEIFTLLKKLFTGEKFSVYPKEGKTFTNAFPKTENFKEELDFYLELFTSLRNIEQYFKIRFSDIEMSSINDDILEKVNLLMTVVNNTKIEFDWNDEFKLDSFVVTDENLRKLEKINQNDAPVYSIYEDEYFIELYGHSIRAGFMKLEYKDPIICNLNEIINRTEDNPKLISKSKKVIVSFLNELENKIIFL